MDHPRLAETLLPALAESMGLDVSGWTYAGGTGVGGYFYVAPRVLVAVPVPGYKQTESDARLSLAEFERIATEEGHPHAVIVLVDGVTSQDASARRVWSDAEEKGRRASLALVCRSPLSRAIGSFFIGLNRPSSPTKMFRDFADALRWSSSHVGAR